MKLCPCLECLFPCLRKRQKVKNREYQEQSLVRNQEQSSPLDVNIETQRKIKRMKEKIEISRYFQEGEGSQIDSDLLDVKMELAITKPEVKKGAVVQRDIQDLIKEELGLMPQSPQEQRLERQPDIASGPFELLDDLGVLNFSINLDPIDPYYHLIHDKTIKMEQLLSKQGNSLQLGNPNNTKLQIMTIQGSKQSTFIINYSLQCSFSYYRSLFKNDKLLASFGLSIAQIKVLQTLKSNLTRNTIKFKKVGGFQPRDCFYIKYQNSTKHQHWQVYIHDEKHQPSSSFKTCEIFCLKNIKQINQKELQVRQYLEIDLQSANTASILPKLTTQFRNYLNNLQTHINNNYEQQTA